MTQSRRRFAGLLLAVGIVLGQPLLPPGLGGAGGVALAQDPKVTAAIDAEIVAADDAELDRAYANANYKAGDEAYKKQNYAVAEAAYRKAVAEMPENTYAIAGLSLSLQRQNTPNKLEESQTLKAQMGALYARTKLDATKTVVARIRAGTSAARAVPAPPAYEAPPTFEAAPPARPAVAAAPAAPAVRAVPAAPAATGGAIDVGTAVEVVSRVLGTEYRHTGHVTKVEPGRYLVHGMGMGTPWDFWYPAADVHPAPVIEPAPAQTGEKGLDGLYLQLNSSMSGGRVSFSLQHYWFLPDGSVYFGLPPGGLGGAEAFAALLKRDVENCGTYGVVGGRLNLQRSGRKAEQFEFHNEGNGAELRFSGPGLIRAGAFKANTALNASYSGGASAGGTSTATGLTLHADGSYESSRIASVSSTGKRVSVGAGAEGSSRGKYELSGNTLTLTDAGGKAAQLTAYPKPDKDESPPRHLCIDGEMYELNR